MCMGALEGGEGEEGEEARPEAVGWGEEGEEAQRAWPTEGERPNATPSSSAAISTHTPRARTCCPTRDGGQGRTARTLAPTARGQGTIPVRRAKKQTQAFLAHQYGSAP
jgi:hypothetical protein